MLMLIFNNLGFVIIFQMQSQWVGQKNYSNRLMEEQDQHLEEINDIAFRLKQQGKEMNQQLKNQHKVIEDLDQQFVLTNTRINGVQQKLAALLQTNDMGQVCTVLMMLAFMIIMITLIIVF